MGKGILKPSKFKRVAFFLLADTLIFSLSLILALFLRFDFSPPKGYIESLYLWVPILVSVKLLAIWLGGGYSINWRFVGINELFRVILVLSAIGAVAFIINLALQTYRSPLSLPKSVILIDYLLSTLLIAFFRISKRVYREVLKSSGGRKRILIIGAGSTGERILREIQASEEYLPVGFLDDDDMKVGTKIRGVRVLGKLGDLKPIVSSEKVNSVIIAIPSLNHKRVREIFNTLSSVGIKDIKIAPSLDKLSSQPISVKDLREISIEDLLSREVVRIDDEEIRELIKGKRVLVSGAGGSIGSEIVRQLVKFEPSSIVALDIDETELHNLHVELSGKYKALKVVIADVRDKEKLRNIFSKELPQIVFHAAAYKHVPLMEFFPEEAIKTNVLGTYNMAKLSEEFKAEKFVNISTDKAVKPKNVMGATKRIAELICLLMNKNSDTSFISVRFGNVLGSRGSVIPIFLEQIKRGGPVTITHPDMERFFMTIPEAVILVIQASALGKGGEIFILDMGQPVKITKLAEELIRLQGLKPYEDIDIVFTGLRPGEKLSEELALEEESLENTKHPKIFKVITRTPEVELEELIKYILKLAGSEPQEVAKKLIELVNGLAPSHKGLP